MSRVCVSSQLDKGAMSGKTLIRCYNCFKWLNSMRGSSSSECLSHVWAPAPIHVLAFLVTSHTLWPWLKVRKHSCNALIRHLFDFLLTHKQDLKLFHPCSCACLTWSAQAILFQQKCLPYTNFWHFTSASRTIRERSLVICTWHCLIIQNIWVKAKLGGGITGTLWTKGKLKTFRMVKLSKRHFKMITWRLLGWTLNTNTPQNTHFLLDVIE